MKIEINNFGPIKKFTYDLSKDFIVTYGHNNIGKSYSMEVVYLLLKTLITNFGRGYRYIPSNYYPIRYVELPNDMFRKIVTSFIESKEISKDITNDIINSFFEILSEIFLLSFLNSCNNTFANFGKTSDQESIINIELGDYKLRINLNEGKITGSIINMLPVNLRKTDSDFHRSRKYKTHMDIYVYKNKIDQPKRIIEENIRTLMVKFEMIINNNFNNIYFLPASRSGIYSGMNAFGSIVAELSKNRAFLTKKIELPGISEPISDYFISLSNIKPQVSKKYADYYSKIESKILKGSVSFNKSRNSLVYIPNDMNIEFDMTKVSSMVSEVSPIVAFLKYILSETNIRRLHSASNNNAKSILFIEEPEAHLHPSNQVALIEIFAQLVSSADIKLIISSHSNYIFNKLNNLVLSKKLDSKIYQPIILETNGDENKSVSRCLEIDELGATDENFSDVSTQLYYEREKIIQNINEKSELSNK